MRTPVYVKIDIKEQLLLSKGVCRQLGIVTYHREVVPCKGQAGEPSLAGEDYQASAHRERGR